MAQFSLLETLSGCYNVFKSEFIDVQFSRWQQAPGVDMTGKVILITGATSGIPTNRD
jgi:hypothetical protein